MCHFHKPEYFDFDMDWIEPDNALKVQMHQHCECVPVSQDFFCYICVCNP